MNRKEAKLGGACRRLSRQIVAAAAGACACGAVQAAENLNYRFEQAAQEITQLFWLAETANLCGWASADDAAEFKLFSVRFLAAHLSDRNRTALLSLVTEDGYEARVRKSAAEGVAHNCDSRRWQMGWSSYKTAADQHATEF
jgi:hypothetical protein